MKIKRIALVFSGRVQGVFFRKFTLHQAIEWGIMGFVHNQPDGTVYAEAQGTMEALESFTHACKSGPPMSKVNSVSIQEIPTVEEPGFHIR